MPYPGTKSSSGSEPDGPENISVVAGDAQVTISFDESAYKGKDGTVTYRATLNPGNISSTNAASPITVVGLTNGTAYAIEILAETPSRGC